ncbi:K+-transporting ATPase ATPase A chain [Paenibacillus phyllosphaerae]|uniref:Potassium-transporting ATPase potassium-binding subunit n=1 Tax=Paenibacillus phyllosphaerae TaxID=274593 RepID=A0A7W5FNS0_9BACL|nr:potassium-transporting ATPase subunit KdpA [Paenibacillus phyllosphaerae]MBB3111595.1 K+-transporting ATPase ATPase A chain [Paenibacillus phyllosphaerae]
MFATLSIGVTLLLVLLLARPTGLYIAKAFQYETTRLDRWFGWIETPVLRLGGIRRDDQTWKQYALAVIVSSLVMILLVYLVFRTQAYLPLNPSHIANMEPTLAFNTAISFMTNTNLQHYSGESGLSYLSQMIAIVFLMFTGPAVGLSAAIALIRGLAGKPIGNFFIDLTRSITRIFLPVSFVMAIVFVALGVPQTLEPTVIAHTLSGEVQEIARGPVGSLLSIKQFGNNGGGFFGVNSAHPFENPGAVSNLLQIVLMMLLGTAIPFTYGKMVGNPKQGRVLFLSMTMLFIVLLGVSLSAENAGNPVLNAMGIQHEQGSMEGKEVRFGMVQSSFFSVVTTAFETGAVNTMHDTLTPLGGLVTISNMMLNTVFGSVGAGMMNVLMYVMIGVFLSGLMVGRTPEFLGKKIEGREMKLIAVTLLIQPMLILAPTAIALFAYPETISNPGFHGLTQALYEFTSSAANNGSGFEGLGDNTPFWNIATGIVMYLGRYFSVVTLLAVAGSLAAKKPVSETSGTFRTDNGLFAGVFLGTVLIVGALTFFPALVLGPVAEYLTLKP